MRVPDQLLGALGRCSRSQRRAVRRSCQTIARWIGSPVARSQTTIVSRWLVMPIAAIAPARPAAAIASRATASVSRQISSGSCSTQPRRGIDAARTRAARWRRPAHRRRTGWRASRSCPDRSPRHGRLASRADHMSAARSAGRASGANGGAQAGGGAAGSSAIASRIGVCMGRWPKPNASAVPGAPMVKL